jgi:hypothetical protein
VKLAVARGLVERLARAIALLAARAFRDLALDAAGASDAAKARLRKELRAG